MNLSETEKKMLKMRMDGESNEDVVEHLGVSLDDVAKLFTNLQSQLKTSSDTIELMNMMKGLPTQKTEKRSIRLLDDIPMEHLINYMQMHFADEMWEALAEDRHP